jgi:hypothetical protein
MVGRTVAAFMEDYDVILQPVAAQPPLPLGVINLDREDLQQMYREMIGFIPYTGIYNLTGQPSANIPLHLERRRPADRHDVHDKVRRRSHTLPPRRPTRTGTTLVPALS